MFGSRFVATTAGKFARSLLTESFGPTAWVQPGQQKRIALPERARGYVLVIGKKDYTAE